MHEGWLRTSEGQEGYRFRSQGRAHQDTAKWHSILYLISGEPNCTVLREGRPGIAIRDSNRQLIF